MNTLHLAPDIHWGATLTLVGICGLVILAVGIVAGAGIGRARRRSLPLPPAVMSDDRGAIDTLSSQRAALVSGCVKVRVLLDDQVLTQLLDKALHSAGIEIIDPVGTRANPDDHRTAGTEPAASPERDGFISRTLRPAFRDAGQIVRAADVVVYKWRN